MMSDQKTMVEPIRKSITVACGVDYAFMVFTERFGSWWPLEVHSMGKDRAKDSTIEPRPGGRVFEQWTDGTQRSWGEVLVWEPPHRLVLSWKPNEGDEPPTEVEVRFADEDGATRVFLEHRGWERLGARAETLRPQYDEGWPVVLTRFAQATTSGTRL